MTNGDYTPVDHAKIRLQEREVTIPEMEYVLLHGRHEKRKDEYKEEHKSWNYAIRGKTISGRELRVCVALDKTTHLLIVTAIDL